MASLTEFIRRRLRLKVNQAKSAVARPEDRHFLGFRLRGDPQSGTVEVLLSERTKRNAMERVRQLTPRNWGGSLVSLRLSDQRMAARLARVLRDRLRLGDANDAQDRRPSAASVARDSAAPLETQTNDRTQPHRAGRPAAVGVAAGLSGPQVLVGAEPHPGCGSRASQSSVLSRTRAPGRGRDAPPRIPAHQRPRIAATGALGMTSRSQTGRRRGS